jgi:hypothetical protein
MTFKKWPSINKFSDVYRHAQRTGTENVTLRGKIKLHGTNAAIRIKDNVLTGQKRSSDVAIGNDNAGFAVWLDKVDYIGGAYYDDMIIFGEWAGPGIQSGDAVTSIPHKKFFVFALTSADMTVVVLEPVAIQAVIAAAFGDNTDIMVLPWYSEPTTINMMIQSQAQDFVSDATKVVDEVIGVEDPYIKEMFGVSGVGEGLVYYAVDRHEDWAGWMFKIKSETHSVNSSKKRDHVAPEKPEGVDDFIEMFFTENRFEQMLNETLDGVADRKRTGDFLKAVMSDVHKESVNEMELVDFEWKDVAKYSVVKTKNWLFAQADSLA